LGTDRKSDREVNFNWRYAGEDTVAHGKIWKGRVDEMEDKGGGRLRGIVNVHWEQAGGDEGQRV
jgi:hypothetical protein